MPGYMHFTVGTNRVTAAIEVEGQTAHVAFAFCAPGDQFSRKLGRAISAGRLSKSPQLSIPIIPGRRTKEQVHEFIQASLSSGSTTLWPAAWSV